MDLPIVVALSLLAAMPMPWLHRKLGDHVTYLAALVPLVLVVEFARRMPLSPTDAVYTSFAWAPQLGLAVSFYLDGLSLFFSLIVTAVGTLVCVYAGGYLEGHSHLGRFYAYLLVFMGAMLGTVLAGNLLTLYVFWELTTLSSFLLIGFENEKAAARTAARQALIVTAAGGLALLVGLILFGTAAGTFEIPQLLGKQPEITGHVWYYAILLLVLAGVCTKSAQFPFHFWLPRAMEAPTPVSAYLHSATMVKLGVFVLARFAPVLGGTDEWRIIVTTIGALTMFVGAFLAFFEHDLKAVLAYLTINVLGTLVMLLGLGTELAVQAALAYLFAHALYKGALFLMTGAVDHETGTRDLRELGGLRKQMPLTCAIAALAALSMAGILPLFGFIAKELYFEAVAHAPRASLALTVVSLVSSVLLVAGAILTGYAPFFGRAPRALQAHEAGWKLWGPPFVLATAGLALGVAPQGLAAPLIAPAVHCVFVSQAPAELALWHGFTQQFVLSVTAVAGGIGVYLARRRLLRIAPDAATWNTWSFDRAYERCISGLQSAASFQTRVLQRGYLRQYVIVVLTTAVALVTSVLLVRVDGPALTIRGTGVRFYEAVPVVLIVAGASVATIASSRFVAVASLGIVGFNIAWLFQIFGAPDLAMTQIVIESLTVLLFVLAFSFLPRFTIHSSKASRACDAALGALTGAVITVLLLLSANTEGPAPISAYFAERSFTGGHGRNVVNVILVDFRALDTLGEISVLSAAAVGSFALIKLVRRHGDET